MDADLKRTLRGLEEATEFARAYRFELTDAYRALIARVEAMPGNQSGAVKSARWLGGRSGVNVLATQAHLIPRKP
jgi:hypothetical protein